MGGGGSGGWGSGLVGVDGLAENRATQPSLAGTWAELGNKDCLCYNDNFPESITITMLVS